jgi:hypothetical protein
MITGIMFYEKFRNFHRVAVVASWVGPATVGLGRNPYVND